MQLGVGLGMFTENSGVDPVFTLGLVNCWFSISWEFLGWELFRVY